MHSTLLLPWFAHDLAKARRLFFDKDAHVQIFQNFFRCKTSFCTHARQPFMHFCVVDFFFCLIYGNVNEGACLIFFLFEVSGPVSSMWRLYKARNFQPVFAFCSLQSTLRQKPAISSGYSNVIVRLL